MCLQVEYILNYLSQPVKNRSYKAVRIDEQFIR